MASQISTSDRPSKRSFFSICVQWPQRPKTCNWLFWIHSTIVSEVCRGITLSSRPCTISVGCWIARTSASACAIASTQRWRGAGNMAEKDSWKPGRMLAW